MIGKIKIRKTRVPAADKLKIAYIGQGRFALLRYEDPSDVKSFKIIKTIEWEGRDAELPWRSELSSLYSQV